MVGSRTHDMKLGMRKGGAMNTASHVIVWQRGGSALARRITEYNDGTPGLIFDRQS